METLARRFGQTNEPRDAQRRFHTRRQLDNETIPEFESALRSLYREAWPNATPEQRDADLKRYFEEGLSHPTVGVHLQLHARDANFATTILKAPCVR